MRVSGVAIQRERAAAEYVRPAPPDEDRDDAARDGNERRNRHRLDSTELEENTFDDRGTQQPDKIALDGAGGKASVKQKRRNTDAGHVRAGEQCRRGPAATRAFAASGR